MEGYPMFLLNVQQWGQLHEIQILVSISLLKKKLRPHWRTKYATERLQKGNAGNILNTLTWKRKTPAVSWGTMNSQQVELSDIIRLGTLVSKLNEDVPICQTAEEEERTETLTQVFFTFFMGESLCLTTAWMTQI